MQRLSVNRGVSGPLFVVFAAALAASCGELPVGEGGVRVAPASSPQQESGLQKAPQGPARLTQEAVCYDGDPGCTPTGAHGKHGGFACSVCHKVAGRLVFDSTGPAYRAGATGTSRPTFDATAKTCSNVACHGVPAGTFSYYYPGNEMDADGYPIPELKTVNYGGTMAATAPNWYATGTATCTGCHGNPPAHGSDGSNAWHSGFHANNQNVGSTGPNACELCHNIPTNVNVPIAQSANGAGTAILQPTFHGNGTVNVNARWRSQCFGCH